MSGKGLLKKLILIPVIILLFFTGFFAKSFFEKKETIILPHLVNGKYKVTKIIDGDTIEIENGEKIRLIGIDSPEINERWGPEAKEYNEKNIFNKKVRIELDKPTLDKYGRTLAYVWFTSNITSKETMINETLLEEGYAKIYLVKGEAKPKYLEKLIKAETWARDHHNGVWLDEWIK